MDLTTVNRRRYQRYEMRLPVHYRVSQKGTMPRIGSGTTCELSTAGLSFRCRRQLPVGAHIEIMVDWPSRYDDLFPIALQLTGFIVRTTGGRIGVRVTSRKFLVDTANSEAYRATA